MSSANDWREQEAMPVEAVHIDIAPADHNPRPIVGEGRPGAGALQHDLGLGEGWVERIGGREQIERRAERDGAGLLALNDGGADHIDAVAPRHDVEREARMQQPHGAREVHLAALHHDPLAAHAAQGWQLGPWRQARGSQ